MLNITTKTVCWLHETFSSLFDDKNIYILFECDVNLAMQFFSHIFWHFGKLAWNIWQILTNEAINKWGLICANTSSCSSQEVSKTSWKVVYKWDLDNIKFSYFYPVSDKLYKILMLKSYDSEIAVHLNMLYKFWIFTLLHFSKGTVDM